MHIPSQTSSAHSQAALALAASQLSSGKRVTSAAIDPSGLAIANAALAQASGYDQGASNAQDAINVTNVAQGALVTISDAAQHLGALSVRANNDLLSSSDRANLQTEANQTAQEINSVAQSTQFNGLSLLDGSTPTASVQTGANLGSTVGLSLPPSGAAVLGVSHVDLSSSAAATTSQYAADAAVTAIGTSQAKLGSQTVALQFDQQNSETASNNLAAAASNILDANVAATSTKLAIAQAASRREADLQVQAALAASSLIGLFKT